MEGNGIKAIKGLSKEYKDDPVNKSGLNLLKAEFQNRNIKAGESITQFTDHLETLKLRLINMGHNTSDEEMISRITLGMVSTVNQTYLQVRQMLTIHPIRSLNELITALRNLDGQKQDTTSSSTPVPTAVNSHTVDTSASPGIATVPVVHSVNFSQSEKPFHRRSAQRPSRNEKKDLRCLRCGGKAHIASECKKAWDDIRKPSNSSHSSQPPPFRRKIFKTSKHKKFTRATNREDKGQNQEDFSYMISTFRPNIDYAILDSGCTTSISPTKSILSDYSTFNSSVNLADNSTIQVIGKGSINMIKEVLYCPEAKHFLISASKLVEDSFSIIFSKEGADICSNNVQLLRARLINGLFLIPMSDLLPQHALMASTHISMTNDISHARLGHPSERLLTKINSQNLATGFRYSPSSPLSDCETCLRAKAHRRANRKELRDSLPFQLRHPTSFGDVLHIDSSGPFAVPSIKYEDKHILILIDVATGYLFDFYAREITSDFVVQCVSATVSFIEANGGHVKHYHSDGALTLIGEKVRNLLLDLQITWTFNSPYTPEDNSYAERAFRSIKEKATALMLYSNLPSPFWRFACATSCYLLNRLPKQLPNNRFISPYQAIYNEAPNLSHLRIFGCKAVMHVDRSIRQNDWSGKGITGIFVGYRSNGRDTFSFSLHPTISERLEIFSSWKNKYMNTTPASMHNIFFCQTSKVVFQMTTTISWDFFTSTLKMD